MFPVTADNLAWRTMIRYGDGSTDIDAPAFSSRQVYEPRTCDRALRTAFS